MRRDEGFGEERSGGGVRVTTKEGARTNRVDLGAEMMERMGRTYMWYSWEDRGNVEGATCRAGSSACYANAGKALPLPIS